MVQQRAQVLAKEEVASGVFLVEACSRQVVSRAQPGQFLHLRIGEGPDPLLRRPLSIFKVDPRKEAVSLLFRVVGKGTRALSRERVGGTLDFMGPLGRGFSAPQGTDTAIVVAGGLGVAPLFFLAESLIQRGISVRFLLGAKSEKQLLCHHRLRSLGAELLISTDDGSRGFSGRVTQLLEDLLSRESFDPRSTLICAAGSGAMLAQVASLARQFRIPGQGSMERQMACGVGACLGCVVLCRSQGGSRVYRRVCVDGPVFDLEEVVFEERN